MKGASVRLWTDSIISRIDMASSNDCIIWILNIYPIIIGCIEISINWNIMNSNAFTTYNVQAAITQLIYQIYGLSSKVGQVKNTIVECYKLK